MGLSWCLVVVWCCVCGLVVFHVLLCVFCVVCVNCCVSLFVVCCWLACLFCVFELFYWFVFVVVFCLFVCSFVVCFLVLRFDCVMCLCLHGRAKRQQNKCTTLVVYMFVLSWCVLLFGVVCVGWYVFPCVL